jgi:hypothetical protein
VCPGTRHHDEIVDGEVGCTADDVAGSASPTSTLTARIGFLNSVSSSISSTRPIGQRTADRADGMISSTLVSDADQRLLELIEGTSHPGEPAATTSRSQL